MPTALLATPIFLLSCADSQEPPFCSEVATQMPDSSTGLGCQRQKLLSKHVELWLHPQNRRLACGLSRVTAWLSRQGLSV